MKAGKVKISESPLSTPLVSVVMPAYNQADYIRDAINSVLNQSYQNWELIVVDDGSPDNVAEVVGSFSDTRIRFIHTENRGVSAARNLAISKANAEYILPLDADDTIEPSYMEKCIDRFLTHPSTDVVYCKWHYFGSASHTPKLLPYENYQSILTENRLFVSAMYRRPRWLEIGGYDELMLTGLEDWEFWIRYLNENSVVWQIPERLFNYRIKPHSRNVVGNSGMKGFDTELYILTKHKEKYHRLLGSPLRSLHYKNKYYSVWYRKLWYKLRGKRK